MIEHEDHPWVQAAKVLKMIPLPSIASLAMVGITPDDGGEPIPHVLMTLATPAGVTTVFVDQEHFRNIITQGNDIVKIWESEKSKIQLATVTDMKRETKAMDGLNNKLRP